MPTSARFKWVISLTLGLPVLFIAGLCTPLRSAILPRPKYSGPALPPSTVAVPHERTIAWKTESALATRLYEAWADKPLVGFQKGGKGDAARIILGRLLARRDLPATNAFILASQPWGVSGTSGWQNPRGDYDFAFSVLTTALWLFGDDDATLSPAARDHLLHVLITEDGGDYRATAPHTFGLFEETENHLLMTEGSRYLKNRWLRRHGDPDPRHDNDANGLEQKLLALLAAMRAAGFHEFNSQPYIGYTLLGLLNLEAFASEPLRAAARDLLDYLNWTYALGAYRLRNFPPFRRRFEYAGMTSLTAGYQTSYMVAWLSYAPGPLPLAKFPETNSTHSLIGACLPYRPPDAVVRTLFDKGAGYFVQIGHGAEASPETYSAGAGHLISAGGVSRGRRSVLVARPITLLTDDSPEDLAGVFHLAGPGTDFRGWNNTGVYRNFACAAGPVHIPAGAVAVAARAGWSIFRLPRGTLLAVHSTPAAGILAIFPAGEPAALLAALVQSNPDAASLAQAFQFPTGPRLTYDLHSPPDRWVMVAVDGRPLDREFDRWPLISGQM